MPAFDFDRCLDDLAAPGDAPPLDALAALLDHWPEAAAPCRALLAGYVAGIDQSQRTEGALFYLAFAFAQMADTDAFADLCRLGADPELSTLVFGEDALSQLLPCMLINTFGTDPAPLQALIETPDADEYLRAQAIMSLAYLTRTSRLTDGWMQDFLSRLRSRLPLAGHNYVWHGWVSAVACLGYGALAQAAEGAMRQGLVDPEWMTPKDFWADLRDAQAEPGSMTGPGWQGIGPLGDALEELEGWFAPDDSEHLTPDVQQPVVNPLRNVGRNDPCPCGSGRKYKKCCLAAA